jgi:hypothetical protein
MGKRLHRLVLLVGLLLGSASAVAQPNYQGLWWASPSGSESGWGINLSHQDDTIFAAWFGYDTADRPWWLVAALTKTADGTYNGDVATGTGPPFGAATFDPGLVKATVVGTATLPLADGNHANFGYTVNGESRTKAITRQVFAPPGTVCSSAAPTPAMVTMSFRVSVPSNTPAGDQLLIRTFFAGEKREEFMLTAVPGGPGVFQTSALLPEGTVMQDMYLRNFDQGRAET